MALIVNGLYLVILFMPSTPHDPHNPDAHTFGRSTAYSPHSPASGSGLTQVFASGGQIHVSLSNDMPLLQRPGRTLLFSPSFSASSSASDGPTSAQFRFILFSDREVCPAYDCPVSIRADGETVWPVREGPDAPFPSNDWTRESVPRTTVRLENGQVVESLAALSLTREVPYALFLRIIRAEKVTFRVGSDRVALTPAQIETLREMHLRLPVHPPDRRRSRF